MPAKWFIRKLASYLVETKIPDLNSGFRAFRTDVARQYLNQLPAGFSCVTTITMTFLANGYSVKYVPIEYAKRGRDESKFHWCKDTRRYLHAGRAHDPVVQPAADLPAAPVLLGAFGLVKLVFDWSTRTSALRRTRC